MFTGGMEHYRIDSGNGTFMSENGELSAVSNDANHTIVIDKRAVSHTEGFLRYTVNLKSNQRFASYFRYTSNTQYVRVSYDNGNWYCNWDGGANTFLFTQALNNNTNYYISIYYSGSLLKIWVNGTLKFDGTITNIRTTTGKFGFGVWNYANTHFDDIINN